MTTLTSKQLNDFKTEGNQAFIDMEAMARSLGYDDQFGPVFDAFLMDNPGCVEAIFEWVRDNYTEQINENDEHEDCEEVLAGDDQCAWTTDDVSRCHICRHLASAHGKDMKCKLCECSGLDFV